MTGLYSESEAHVCFPHWQLNMRMMRPFAESSIVFTSSSWAPQRLHVRSSIVFKFVVLKWFVVNMTERLCLVKYINSRNWFQADFAAPRKRFRRNPG